MGNEKLKWLRAHDGALCGVCKGIARTLDLPVGLFRLVWLLSVLFFGVGLWLYIMLAISLPREDKADRAMEPKLLGVCRALAARTDIEVGIVRLLACGLAFISLGSTVVGYLILYFVLDQPSSDNKPLRPPATM